MMTVKEVSSLTGVTIRTLQFYDEIGLLKPAQITEAGYRLYDAQSLKVLQQILFFKELDFTLKEIKTIMEDPQFEQITVFKKQRELIQLKRDRLTSLLGLLDKLIKGESCMELKDFDLGAYFHVLSDFKITHSEEIVKRFGSMEQFDELIADLKSRKEKIIELAEQQYGSLEHYTDAIKKNLGNYLENGPTITQAEAGNLIEQTEQLTKRLTADLSKDVTSLDVQEITAELIAFTNDCNKNIDMGENYWASTAEAYLSNPIYIQVNDKKYGDGASKFIGQAIKAYLAKQQA